MAERAITGLGQLLGWLGDPASGNTLHTVSVRLPLDEQSPPFQARACDISRRGFRLLVDRALPKGCLLNVEFPGISSVLATVLSVTESDDGVVLHCVHTTELGDEHLRVFGARQERASAHDKRRWIRFPCNAKAYYHFAADAEPHERVGRIINISPSGVSLLVEHPAEIGALLGMRLPADTGLHSFLILACVMHCTPQAVGEHALGCVFVRELTSEEFQRLPE